MTQPEPEFDVDAEPGTFQCADCSQFTTSSHYYESASGAMVHEADPDKRAELAAAADSQRVTLFDAAPGEAQPSAMTRETIEVRNVMDDVVAVVDVHPGGSWGTWSGDLPGEVRTGEASYADSAWSAAAASQDAARSLLGVVEPPEPVELREDVPGVLHWVQFRGGTLDGEWRPLSLHGDHSLEDGHTYNAVVPHEQSWRYSLERDVFELVEQ